MSRATPERIRTLQRALCAKAKREPTRRFHFLYDKVWREDILAHAFALSRANGGAPGVDGETFARIEVYGVERWLGELREEVRTERYTPQPVRRVMIPKASGVGQRPLGIPTIRDRVVETAATLVGRKPHEHGWKSVRKIGSSTSVAAICTTRSRTVGILAAAVFSMLSECTDAAPRPVGRHQRRVLASRLHE